jgi:hypothetical protein
VLHGTEELDGSASASKTGFTPASIQLIPDLARAERTLDRARKMWGETPPHRVSSSSRLSHESRTRNACALRGECQKRISIIAHPLSLKAPSSKGSALPAGTPSSAIARIMATPI